MNKLDRFSYELYEKTAVDYDRFRFMGISGRWVDKVQKQIIKSLLVDITDKRVLEAGSGTGRITEFLVERGGKVTTIEPAKSMTEVARKRFLENGLPQPDFISGTLENYNSHGDTYDLIVSVNVFGHLSTPYLFFRKCRNLLSPGGKMLFNFPNLNSFYLPIGFLVNICGKSITNRVFSRWYNPNTIQKMLNISGFRILNQAGHFYVPIGRQLFVLLPIIRVLDTIFGRAKSCLAPSIFILAERK